MTAASRALARTPRHHRMGGLEFRRPQLVACTADDQRRTEFLFGSGTVMIADPDEWDDCPMPAPASPTEDASPRTVFETYHHLWDRPDRSGRQFAHARVPPRWRPESDDDSQPTGNIDNTHDNGVPQNSCTGFPTPLLCLGPSARRPPSRTMITTANEIVVPLNNPAGASYLKLNFGMIEAGNDWWWCR